ncbi:MerR family transcriptional regulator [Paenibacillus sp. MMS20-IR301]|uniref:MerR family transcriptional regulator n=1 Tax=Paenibacillus sp. MMS20-IR301 TaxID=2895946 RepID=UPI0028ECC7F4|nr:MerR family transcriptional regulator [Paenibacillus sp. MMS20-IR301]WNS45452.1 MerR family transcriptional regulator [Paenibacillus sp. MMS20-IR301]
MVQYLRSELAKEARVNIETLRFYEKHGLIPLPQRSAGGYRLYTEETLGRIVFIQNAKNCGFTLREIKKALIKSADGSIGITDFVEVIERKMRAVDLEISKRQKTRERLEELKSNLLSPQRHASVQETLDILQMGD